MVDSVLPIFYIVSFAFLLHRIARSEEPKDLFPLAVLSVAGALIFFYEQANVALLLSVVMIFDIFGLNYGTRDSVFTVLVGFGYVVILQYYIQIILIAQAMLLGLLAEMWRFRSGVKELKGRKELERDLVQIAMGVFIAAMFYFLALPIADFALITMGLIGYLLGSYSVIASNNPLSRFLRRFEREEASFGGGAAWLALGALLTIAFVNNPLFIIPIFFAIFIGDSIATVVGVHFPSPSLPYNKRKGIVGQLAYLVVVAALSYPFIRELGIAIALVGAVVESLPIDFDDNFSVPFILVLLLNIAT